MPIRKTVRELRKRAERLLYITESKLVDYMLSLLKKQKSRATKKTNHVTNFPKSQESVKKDGSAHGKMIDESIL